MGMNVNNGHSTRFWVDNWLSCAPLIKQVTRELFEVEAELPIASYCNEFGNWDIEVLSQALPYDIVLMIMAVAIDPTTKERDAVFWKLKSTGEFLVKTAYDVQSTQSLFKSSYWKQIW
ncbi:Uncharacterized protein TCM_004079 [Theobroma cacao]|uniref:Reverse transcriptase zinc-binding domain-containing protein n=1 Tax=Theobroma cacao TaxID=3641 RepID=A0A061DPY1_THECC|nr:Uncharacterized protein TCM_004079 [Theobroma cacao]